MNAAAALHRARPVLAFRLALREMRGGLRGFYIFLACIALGTAAIAGVNSLSHSISATIDSQGQELLAADIRFELDNRVATSEERAYLDGLGRISVSAGLRSMTRLPDGSNQALVELKAVDGAYPLYGTLKSEPAGSISDMLAKEGDVYGAVAAPLLLERLGVGPGAELLIGNARIRVNATILREPDAVSDGFGFAPRLMISADALAASGLVQTGSLVEHTYKIRLQDPSQVVAVRAEAQRRFPSAGWSIRTSGNAAPSLTANVTRFSQFLTLVGLTALIVGGVGVGNAVRSYLDGKRSVIATFKCLGAPASLVATVYLAQIVMIALIGIAVGLVLGALIPFVAAQFLADMLPVSTDFELFPSALGLAALFGLLTALAFAVLPLGRARRVPATALFRQQGFEPTGIPAWPYLAGALVCLSALAGLAVWTAYDRYISLIFLGAVAFAFVVLRAVALLITWLARRSPRVHSPALRLAIGNIHRPGALTPSVVLSLGLGLALLVTLALIDGNLRRELTGNMAERAPNFFFVDIQGSEIDGFRSVLGEAMPKGKIIEVPMLRGRIVALNGEDVNRRSVPPGGQWVLRGDRGITYAKNTPENSTLAEGAWWPADYSGEPLVSFSAEEAGELGLKLGDTVTVNVLGRNVTARIANFREVHWESLSINFVMVFSPNTFAGAPHAWLATIIDPEATAAEEAAALRAVTSAYPTITSVRVKDALDIVNALLGQLATAIRAAAAVALIASVLVLAGALAAGNRARVHDAVVLKTLGATRGTLIRAFSYEYVILGLATALFALLAGSVSAWFIVSRIMTLPSSFLPDVAVATVAVALVVTVGIGLAGTWRVLGQKAAPVLREL
ncbi:ABC transporter, permease protein, putative [Sinorhizobium sojae CCBAU 05684]|uniref:ABC transporter, permease protein, putative n=1 Tax=Sinorhizobium sojae CCBAU 05684 TaxID=716928 RepID=A0A249PFY0_9HYPH|nr:ABC transporter permease [Sinorhizobium sojae]ASY64675.1 ABC transporter, permease protein, putative [Sinorhizobium sojae CCBAU 05684]